MLLCGVGVAAEVAPVDETCIGSAAAAGFDDAVIETDVAAASTVYSKFTAVAD